MSTATASVAKARQRLSGPYVEEEVTCIMQVNLAASPTFVKQADYDEAMLHRDYPGQVCSIARSLEVIGERWTLLIVRDALVGAERFEEFQTSLGIASNVLTNRLRTLCEEGVLERVRDPARPGRSRYTLTAKGRELAPALIALMKWGDRHYPSPGGPPRLTLHAECGGEVGADLRCARCGRVVGRGELELPPGPGAPRPATPPPRAGVPEPTAGR
jgi:DNA-binding HxlR family transcriptional regulator